MSIPEGVTGSRHCFGVVKMSGEAGVNGGIGLGRKESKPPVRFGSGQRVGFYLH